MDYLFLISTLFLLLSNLNSLLFLNPFHTFLTFSVLNGFDIIIIPFANSILYTYFPTNIFIQL